MTELKATETVTGALPEKYLKVALRNGAVEEGFRPVSRSFYDANESADTIIVSLYSGDDTWGWEEEIIARKVPQSIQLCKMGRRALESGDTAYAASLFEQAYSSAAAVGLLYVRPLINISIAYVSENDLESARAVLETLIEAMRDVSFPKNIQHMILQNIAFVCYRSAQGASDAVGKHKWLEESDRYYTATLGFFLSEPDYFIPWSVVKWQLSEIVAEPERTRYRAEAADLWSRAQQWANDAQHGSQTIAEYVNKYAELQHIEAYRVGYNQNVRQTN